MSLLKTIKSDLKRHGGKGNPIKVLLVWFLNPSFRLLLNYRIGNYFAKRRNPVTNFIILILRKRQVHKWSCDISYTATLGERINFPHPLGIVIGNGSKVGDDTMIWHNVTLGSHGKSSSQVLYPTIQNQVKIYPGATVIGSIQIGNHATIGASALVNIDVPEKSTAIGIPCKIISPNK